MDLTSDYPYWLLNKGLAAPFSSLDRDITVDIAIIGAGISGALAAYALRNDGFKIAVFDRRHAGMGSTLATTGLIQYEIDTPLTELIRLVGKTAAEQSYLLSLDAIGKLEKICRKFPAAAFKRSPSLQYASVKKDAGSLEEEYRARRAIGIRLDLLDSAEIKSKFGFEKSAALLSARGGSVNAYALSHGLLEAARRRGVTVCDHTNITVIDRQQRGFHLITDRGFTVRAKKIIIACGYESGKYLPKNIQQLHTTYALVSEPLNAFPAWYRDALIWETAQPYLYLRTTRDRRILIGGKDDDFSSPAKREKALPAKALALEKAFHRLFPDVGFKPDFKWAGTFASTKDGLPYIGLIPERKDMYFALGFGGNGILFSVIAADLIRDQILGRKNQATEYFRFNR